MIPRPNDDAGVLSVLRITGMRDNACRDRITEALIAVPGVRDADVSLFHATARVVHALSCTPQSLMSAVASAGYRAFLDRP